MSFITLRAVHLDKARPCLPGRWKVHAPYRGTRYSSCMYEYVCTSTLELSPDHGPDRYSCTGLRCRYKLTGLCCDSIYEEASRCIVYVYSLIQPCLMLFSCLGSELSAVSTQLSGSHSAALSRVTR